VLTRIDRAWDGCAVDLGLYLISALFALLTAATATLPPHGAWGRIASIGYAVATLVALAQVLAPRLRRLAVRVGLAAATFAGTALLPLIVEAVQRAGGRTDRAQEEVIVVEHGGDRLLHTGTPYLTRDAIAALPLDDRLLGYLPYQPGMAVFGLPRALRDVWWTDARVYFALVTVLALGWAARLLWVAGSDGGTLLRAGQAVLVIPLGTLALAVGGDDAPVLALCLLALAFAARSRYSAAGVVVGIAGALKLFAWPVALVLIALALLGPAGRSAFQQADRSGNQPGAVSDGQAGAGGRRGARSGGGRQRLSWRRALACAAGAIGIPILVLIPPALVDPSAAVENVLNFPLGHGLVKSPAASNFPGHLIALWAPGGNAIATALLVLAGLAIGGWLWRRPPRDAGDAALVCAAGLLAATLLMPATRFGYLLYPLAFAVAAPALRPARPPAVEEVARVPVDVGAEHGHTLEA
jgi:Glycosyltransferase family 87